MPNVIEIRVRATDETGPVYDEVRTRSAASGRDSSAAYTSAFASHVRGEGGKDIGDALSASLQDAGPVEDALSPSSGSGQKIRDNAKRTGEQAGQDMGESMSPVLATALLGATAVAAPALLAGMGVAFAGVTALALRNNVVIKNDFKELGTDASNAFTSAAAPAAGTLHQALVGLDGTVKGLAPELRGLFVNAEPDITAVVGGVGAFATNVLPGMSSAVKNSQVIVADFSNSLGSLGSSVGGMFQGLTRDASTTGAGLQSLVGTVGNLAQTLGGVLGSAASAGSAALMALDPVLNTTLTLIQKVANPGTVGAAGGMFAAMKFDPSIASGLKNAASSLSTYAKGAVDAEGEATRLGSAASGMAGALGKGASIMSGPWGLAIGAGVGLLSGLAGAIYNAAHASDALTLSQQGLQDAVSKDNGTMGASTAAYVAAQAQSDGLAKSAAAAGVSLETWTQAVLGNKDAQQQVTDAVMTTNQSTINAQIVTDSAARSTGKFADEQQDAKVATEGQASATNRLTDQNKQLLNSMTAQHQQIVDAINKQQALTSATNQLTNATDIFAASLKAQYQTQVASAQQSALNSVAAMNLGASQTALSQKLYASITAYQLTTAAAQGYASELQSINGTADSLAQAQNAVDQQLVTAKTTFQQNGYAITGMTQAAVANRTALNQAATSIQALGVAQYQASGNINKANGTIQQQIDAYVKATGATGKAKDAIEAYLKSLAKIPPSASTSISLPGANTAISQAQQLANLLTNLPMQERRAISITGPGKATGGNIGAAATGGARGARVLVGEYGPEIVNLPYGSSVMPNANVQSMAARGSSGGSGSSGGAEVHFSGGLDSAFATWFMKLVRTGQIQIKQKAIVP